MLDDLRWAVLATGPRNFDESRLRPTVLTCLFRDLVHSQGGDFLS